MAGSEREVISTNLFIRSTVSKSRIWRRASRAWPQVKGFLEGSVGWPVCGFCSIIRLHDFLSEIHPPEQISVLGEGSYLIFIKPQSLFL